MAAFRSKIANTIKEIIAARDKADAEIFEKEQALQKRREHIKDIAYERDLTAAEKKELKDINAAMGALADASGELGLMTVIALEKSAEVQRLSRVVESLNADLKSKMQDVASIAQNIQKLNNLFKAIGTVVSGLTKLAPLLL
jgi:chromosome segregation ATPase